METGGISAEETRKAEHLSRDFLFAQGQGKFIDKRKGVQRV